jgi:hypothetical protein
MQYFNRLLNVQQNEGMIQILYWIKDKCPNNGSYISKTQFTLNETVIGLILSSLIVS